MNCQICPHRSSCVSTKPVEYPHVPSCYVPNEPNIPIKPWFPVQPYTPTYPQSYTTSTPVIPYYWERIIPVSEELPVIIQD